MQEHLTRTFSLDIAEPNLSQRHGLPNFVRTPNPTSERFSLAGLTTRLNANGQPGGDGRGALHAILAKLARRMARSKSGLFRQPLVPHTGEPQPRDASENPSLPSGYTYLLQLMAHDMVDTVPSVSIGSPARPAVRNARSRALMLDTIYGAGPEEAPHAYVFSRRHSAGSGLYPRSRLRIGRKIEGRERLDAVSHCPFRDVARAAPEAIEDGTASFGGWRTDPLLADPRNDSLANISQLTVLFHLLHNDIMDVLDPPGRIGAMDIDLAYRQFQLARTAVTLIFRAIVETDVLPRILHPAVNAAFRGRRPLRLGHGDDVPVEFSHGAFRFGHSMVREAYRVNSEEPQPTRGAFDQTSLRNFRQETVDFIWAVDWARYFDLRATGAASVSPNLSRRIGPSFAAVLDEHALFPPEIPGVDEGGLANRDLLGSSYFGLWSVPALFDELRTRLEIEGHTDLVPGYAAWPDVIRHWLLNDDTPGVDATMRLTDAEVERVAADPPLALFVLIEAAFAGPKGVPDTSYSGGRHLGPLGSLIVGDTIYRSLRAGQFGDADTPSTLAQRIETAAAALVGDRRALAPVTRNTLDTMPALLEFLRQRSKFDG